MPIRLSSSLRVGAFILGSLLTVAPTSIQAAEKSATQYLKTINRVLDQEYAAGEPGAVIIIVKDGKTVFSRGYGSANLELGVGMHPDMAFRVGPLADQFTAVAILMLAEQGKLALTDRISKYLPGFREQAPTIEQLLTHTSGIAPLADIPSLRDAASTAISTDAIVKLAQEVPLNAPGKQQVHSELDYLLLSAIVAATSGTTYQEFINVNIFKPLAMQRSFFDNGTRIIARRSSGYRAVSGGFEHAQPATLIERSAPGTLFSTVEDLRLFDTALYGEGLLKQASLQRMFAAPASNNAGKIYGWSASLYEGQQMFEQGGAGAGFASHIVRVPEQKLFVAVLANQDSGASSVDQVGFKVTSLLLGKPYTDPAAITLPSALTEIYTGLYKTDTGDESQIIREQDQLFLQRKSGERLAIFPYSTSEFFVRGSFTRLRFVIDAHDEVTGLVEYGRHGRVAFAAKSVKPVAMAAIPEAGLNEAVFSGTDYSRYLGRYQVAADFIVIIAQNEKGLAAEVNGGETTSLTAETDNLFRMADSTATIEFANDKEGNVTGLRLQQGGQIVQAARIE